jgi:lipoyl(octanoyl) transferase
MIPPSSTSPPEWLIAEGLIPYPEALAAMEAQVAAIRAGAGRERVWMVEHPPSYTAGTSARPEELTSDRFPHYAAGRGGQWTYHGPGQRTGYVMLDLQRAHGPVPPRDVRAFVHALEEWMIRALWRFNVKGERRAGPRRHLDRRYAGGRSQDRRHRRAGDALGELARHRAQREPDLAHFGGIVPCGLAEYGVTSLAHLGLTATMAEAGHRADGGVAGSLRIGRRMAPHPQG